MGATRERINRAAVLDSIGHFFDGVDDEAGLAMNDELRCAATAEGDHGRPASHRLRHHETERLVPCQRHEQALRGFVQFALLRCVGLAEVYDLFAIDERANDFFEKLPVVSINLAGEQEPPSEAFRDSDRVLWALLRGKPAKEEEVSTLDGLEWEGVDVNRVVDVSDVSRVAGNPVKLARF